MLDVSMVYSPKLSFVANGNNLTGGGLAASETICFGSLEFIVDTLSRLSLSFEESDSGAIFVGMVHSGSPSLDTTLEVSSGEGSAISSAGGTPNPQPRGCNVVTPTVPITSMMTLGNTPVLQTIPMVKVQTAAPRSGMELLPDQQ
jgi:hypothetical protein